MLKHRFMPYIVVGCVLVLLGVAYLSYVNYKADQNHKEWVAEMTALQHSIEGPTSRDQGRHDHSSHPPIHHGEEKSIAARTETTEHETNNLAFVGMTPDGEYSYDIAGRLYISEEPMSQKEIDIDKYLLTGEMTPLVEEAMREAQEDTILGPDGQRYQVDPHVIQTVLGPDGQLHQVIVPEWMQYEEGDAILQSETNHPFVKSAFERATNPDIRTPRRRIMTDEGEVHSLPAEYYAIEDPYEQEEYFKKFDQSIQLGTSIAGIEQMIAAGKLDLSLTETEKEMVDLQLAMHERRRPLLGKPFPLSDKPPVKVSFLPDEGEDALPGWMQKQQRNLRLGSGKPVDSGLDSGADFVSEGDLPIDTDTAPVGSDVPVSPSDLSDTVKPTPSSPDVADIEKQLTPQGIEAELSQGLLSERFDKAQQLIEQYGAEEGLRRLREMDPEAARRFELERRNPPTRDTSDDAASTQ